MIYSSQAGALSQGALCLHCTLALVLHQYPLTIFILKYTSKAKAATSSQLVAQAFETRSMSKQLKLFGSV
jgi:hypothetical protein